MAHYSKESIFRPGCFLITFRRNEKKERFFVDLINVTKTLVTETRISKDRKKSVSFEKRCWQTLILGYSVMQRDSVAVVMVFSLFLEWKKIVFLVTRK